MNTNTTFTAGSMFTVSRKEGEFSYVSSKDGWHTLTQRSDSGELIVIKARTGWLMPVTDDTNLIDDTSSEEERRAAILEAIGETEARTETETETDSKARTETSSMSEQLTKYTDHYVKVKVNGRTTKTNNDELAMALLNLAPDQVVEMVASLVEGKEDLAAKYAHLNPGQRRMNAGNIIRAAIKNDVLTMDEVREYIG